MSETGEPAAEQAPPAEGAPAEGAEVTPETIDPAAAEAPPAPPAEGAPANPVTIDPAAVKVPAAGGVSNHALQNSSAVIGCSFHQAS